MLPVSALSDAANKLRGLLLSQIDDIEEIKQLKIGHPKETFDDMDSDLNNLNLFFYDIRFDGYPADGLSDDPFYVRLYCLITAVGANNVSTAISAGENDLRLIGEVMRVLHEHPILSIDRGDNVEIAQLQIIPHLLDLDNLNHIWSTQGDTAYRLSVAYEMSLAPVAMAIAAEPSPLVATPQMLSWGAMNRLMNEDKAGVISLKPGVEYFEIDTDREDWVPHISYVEQILASPPELQNVFKIEGGLTRELDILVAGKENATLQLVWNVWRRKVDHSIVAWREGIPDQVPPQEKEISNAPGSAVPFFPNRIDPDDIDSRRIVKAKLPDDIALADTKAWQAVLYAVHEWEHEEPLGSGNRVVTGIISNPVLFYGIGVGG